MKTYRINTLIFIFIFCANYSSFAQANSINYVPQLPDNLYQIKGGVEIYRREFTGGIGHNFYTSKYAVFLSEINFIGVPTISGSFKFVLPVYKRISIAPLFGVGAAYVFPPYYFSPVLLVGGQLLYRIKYNCNLFLEVKKTFFFSNDEKIGLKSFQEKSVKDYPPLTIMIGIEL